MLISLIGLVVLEIAVYALYPVENINREVDSEENSFFKMKLKLFLVIDFVIAIICAVLKNECFVFLIAVTFFIIVITMALGKYKNIKIGFVK